MLFIDFCKRIRSDVFASHQKDLVIIFVKRQSQNCWYICRASIEPKKILYYSR